MARELPARDTMNEHAFTNAMNQIAAESHAQNERELEAQRRQRLYARLFTGVKALLWLGLIAGVFSYRSEIQQFVSETVLSRPQVGQIDAKTGEALRGIQAQAEKRDQVLNAINQ